MNLIKSLLLLSLVFLLLTSCHQGDSAAGSGFQFPDNAELQLTATFQSAGEEIFAQPNMILPINEEQFIIADTQLLQIHLLDLNENYFHTFGRAGQGPGEFQRFSEITADGNQLRVYDGRSYKVTELTVHENRIEYIGESDFSFIPLSDFPGAMFWRFIEGQNGEHLAIYRDFNILSEESPRFTRIIALKYDDSYSPITEEPVAVHNFIAELDFGNGVLSLPYYQRGFFTQSNGRLVYAKNDYPEIRIYDTSGEQINTIKLPDTRVTLTRDDKVAAFEHTYRNAPEPDRFRNEVNPKIPDQRPIIRTMNSDSQGRIWVRIFTNNDSEADWLVFDENGSPLVSLSLPDGHTFRNAIDNNVITGFIGDDGPEIALHRWTTD
jgi:hypothetical protein